MCGPILTLTVLTTIQMLNIGGKERTAQTWHDVTARAGLKLVEIHPDKQTPAAVIECDPA